MTLALLVGAALLAAMPVVLMLGAKIERTRAAAARNLHDDAKAKALEETAKKLDVAMDGLAVVKRVMDNHEHGEAWLEATLDVQKSAETDKFLEDLFGRGSS